MDQRKSKYLITERDCGRRAESIHAADGTGISIRLVKIISVMLGEIAETAEYFARSVRTVGRCMIAAQWA